jgi:nitroreductase
MSDYVLPGPLRIPNHPVDSIFPNRWSPRAMSGAHISEATLQILFEAARWAPSANNSQPWRFVFARRATAAWTPFFDALVPGNQLWCKEASALVVIVSRLTFEYNGKPAPNHSFDTGSAWMSLALQGSMLGLVVHGMGGFDAGKAREAIGLPEGYMVEAMCAIGYPAPTESLPEALRAKEVPSGRKRVDEIAFEGQFPKS